MSFLFLRAGRHLGLFVLRGSFPPRTLHQSMIGFLFLTRDTFIPSLSQLRLTAYVQGFHLWFSLDIFLAPPFVSYPILGTGRHSLSLSGDWEIGRDAIAALRAFYTLCLLYPTILPAYSCQHISIWFRAVLPPTQELVELNVLVEEVWNFLKKNS